MRPFSGAVTLLSEIRERLRALLFRREEERALDEEVRFHIEMEAETLVREAGLSAEEARREAVLRFGGVERYKEEVRDERGTRLLEDLARDLRFAVRTLRKRPGAAAVTVATLAAGIGVSVTIYGAGRTLVTDAVPFPEPERMVTVESRGEDGSGASPSYGELRAWEAAASGRLVLGGYAWGSHTIGDGSRTFRVPGSRVTGGFFSALGIDPLHGRLLSPGDAEAGAGRVAVIAERLWKGRLGADPDIVGTSIRIDGREHAVVGVVPSGLQFPPGADVWTPLAAVGAEADSLRVGVVGRLGPGATSQGIESALAAVQRGLNAERPAGDRAAGVVVRSFVDAQRPEAAPLLLLQAAVLVLLLIAATNASGLMLTRTLRRRREVAVRVSLGASRGRIVRQLLVESGLIALASGVLGLLVAWAGTAALRGALPADLTRHMLGWDRLGLDGHALVFGLVLAAVTGLAFGILPALRAVRGDLTAPLRDGAVGATEGRRGSRTARLLLSGEVALALTLLLIAGLLTRSLLGLVNDDPGFEPDGVLAVEWGLPPERYERGEAVTRFQYRLLERLGGMPGVRSAALVSNLPMSRTGWSRRYRLPGDEPDSDAHRASWRPVTPGYVSTLGIPRIRGRGFDRADDADAPRVAIVSEALAERHWPDAADVLGRRLLVEDEEWTVVGVAGDVHDYGVERRAEPTVYVPQPQAPTHAGFLAVRAAGDPAELAPALRSEIWGLDPEVAVGEIRTLPEMVRNFYAGERLLALLMAVFAVISLLITLVSLYTLVAHSVARRRREIGIRLALGARPRRILAGAVSDGLLWAGAGIVVGLGLSAAAARGLASMLYGIGPLDPAVFALVPGGLLVVAAAASFLPARDAATVDPIETLRAD